MLWCLTLLIACSDVDAVQKMYLSNLGPGGGLAAIFAKHCGWHHLKLLCELKCMLILQGWLFQSQFVLKHVQSRFVYSSVSQQLLTASLKD